jgi:hypothetical protein
MQKENAQPHNEAGPSAQDSANGTQPPKLTPRQRRVLGALLRGDWLQREAVDRIAGASNGPQVILELRRKLLGCDGIEMQQVDTTDRDGRACKPGRYRLTPTGRSRLAAIVAGALVAALDG